MKAKIYWTDISAKTAKVCVGTREYPIENSVDFIVEYLTYMNSPRYDSMTGKAYYPETWSAANLDVLVKALEAALADAKNPGIAVA